MHNNLEKYYNISLMKKDKTRIQLMTQFFAYPHVNLYSTHLKEYAIFESRDYYGIHILNDVVPFGKPHV